MTRTGHDAKGSGPHGDSRIFTAGHPVQGARAAIVLCHGRGATADGMLSLAADLNAPGVAFVAPQASGGTWYPYSFLAPLSKNAPYLPSAIALLHSIVHELNADGIPPERVVLLGFSQGGCLALEYAGRHARRFGGVVGLSAGLIGPRGRSWDFGGSLAGTPVFLGCDEEDPHVPRERVEETGVELRRIGGVVDLRLYQGLGHGVSVEEVGVVRALVSGVLD
jgi:predicted esterase